jgi:hypothetical protein
VAGEGLVQRVSARELGLLLFRRFAADGGSLDHVAACGALSAADKRVVGVALLTLVPFYNFTPSSSTRTPRNRQPSRQREIVSAEIHFPSQKLDNGSNLIGQHFHVVDRFPNVDVDYRWP